MEAQGKGEGILRREEEAVSEADMEGGAMVGWGNG